MSKAVYVVVRNVGNPKNPDMTKVYAICSTRESAHNVIKSLVKTKIGKYKNFNIKQIVMDTVYPKTIWNNDVILIEE